MRRVYELNHKNSNIKLPLSFLFGDVDIYKNVASLDKEIKYKGLELFKKICYKYNENVDIKYDEIVEEQFIDYLNTFINYNEIEYTYDEKISFYENFYFIVDLWYLNFSSSVGETLKKLNSTFANYNVDGMLQTMQSTMINITKHISEIFKPAIINVMTSALTRLGEFVTNTLANIKFPDLTDLEIENIKTIFEKWGKYGWCIVGGAPEHVVYNNPISFEDANEKMSKYYSEKTLNEIMEYLGLKLNNEYFANAIESYGQAKYLSCAMSLFALIDSYCINLDSNTSKRVGKGAIKCLDNNIKGSDKMKDYIYLLFNSANLISCLYVYFEDTENFTRECKVINRNYIMHGMHNKNVNELECKKLFLLLYSLLKFEDEINEIGGF